MKLRIFNTLCCLALLSALAPNMVLARQSKPAPCPSDVVISIDSESINKLVRACVQEALANSSELIALKDIPELTDLKNLKLDLDLQSQPDIIIETDPNQDAESSYDTEKRRTIEKTFKVTSADVLSISNQFGRVKVNTWDKSEIQVKVDIIARSSNADKAQQILDYISVSDSREGNKILFVTAMKPMRIASKANKSFEINYTVYMPENNPLVVKNSFGDVYLASLRGKTNISVSNGSLKTEKLSNPDNYVKVAYGSGNCGYINGGKINLSHGDMYVGGANGLKGSASFAELKVGKIADEMEIDVKHGDFKVDNVSKDIKKIALDSSFGSVSLNFDENTSFNFDVNIQFGDFKVDKSLINVTSLEKGYTSAAYKGKFGGSSPKGVVIVNTKNGDVRFTK